MRDPMAAMATIYATITTLITGTITMAVVAITAATTVAVDTAAIWVPAAIIDAPVRASDPRRGGALRACPSIAQQIRARSSRTPSRDRATYWQSESSHCFNLDRYALRNG